MLGCRHRTALQPYSKRQRGLPKLAIRLMLGAGLLGGGSVGWATGRFAYARAETGGRLDRLDEAVDAVAVAGGLAAANITAGLAELAAANLATLPTPAGALPLCTEPVVAARAALSLLRCYGAAARAVGQLGARSMAGRLSGRMQAGEVVSGWAGADTAGSEDLVVSGLGFGGAWEVPMAAAAFGARE